MTKEYKITTSCTLITEYIVEANSEEEAKEIYFNLDDYGDISDVEIKEITNE